MYYQLIKKSNKQPDCSEHNKSFVPSCLADMLFCFFFWKQMTAIPTTKKITNAERTPTINSKITAAKINDIKTNKSTNEEDNKENKHQWIHFIKLHFYLLKYQSSLLTFWFHDISWVKLTGYCKYPIGMSGNGCLSLCVWM